MEPWQKYQSSEDEGPWTQYQGEASSPAIPSPSMLSVAGNAAWKGLAGTLDLGANVAGAVGNALIPPPLRPGAMQNPIHQGLSAAGMINPENEPQTPGQRILDTAVQGGVSMLANPVKGGAEIAGNVMQGLLGGGAAQLTKEATGSDLLALAVGVLTPMVAGKVMASSATNLKNEVGQATFKQGHEAGFVVPPSQVKKQGIVGNRLGAEAIAGRGATIQEANLKNVEAATAIAKKSIGIPNDMPLSKATLDEVHAVANRPYQEIDALRPSLNMPWFPRFHSQSLLDDLNKARTNAQEAFKEYNRSNKREVLLEAKKFMAEAKSIEQDIDMVAQAAGKPELLAQLKAARVLHARAFDVERAANFADGTVNPQVFARLFDKDKPLSGGLEVIGKFASAFPKITQPGARVSSPNVSGGDPITAAVGGSAGYAALGPAGAAIGAGLPYLRTPSRKFVLSDFAQNRLLREPEPFAQSLYRGALIGRSLMDYQEAVK